jgi:hypothetical protein
MTTLAFTALIDRAERQGYATIDTKKAVPGSILCFELNGCCHAERVVSNEGCTYISVETAIGACEHHRTWALSWSKLGLRAIINIKPRNDSPARDTGNMTDV